MGRQPTKLFARCRSTLRAIAEHYEARRLASDAVTIIESDSATHAPAHLRRVSDEVAATLELARSAESAGERGSRVLERLREGHRQARWRHDQAGLSAATLAIIYLRSRQLGETAKPAREAIEAFVNEWGSRLR